MVVQSLAWEGSPRTNIRRVAFAGYAATALLVGCFGYWAVSAPLSGAVITQGTISATGDLAGIASKFSGLRLEMQMLYPRDAKTKATVKTKSGQTFTGTVEYEDEFTLGIRDSSGIYRSWPMTAITAKLDKPVEAHVTAMSKYTDDDIHNVLAYIQTLK